jgi:hypothetical protein
MPAGISWVEYIASGTLDQDRHGQLVRRRARRNAVAAVGKVVGEGDKAEEEEPATEV